MSNAGHIPDGLTECEKRLRRAFQLEAARCALVEPLRLAAACRAVSQRGRPYAGARHAVAWACALAAVLAIALFVGLRYRQSVVPSRPRASSLCLKSGQVDVEALYAALPRIPPPVRPPPPIRLVPDIVVNGQ
ncbi:MAG: hypothetical protein PHR35_14330 [Kiritimatiellae bacterium]|nr:hypothetical protein [Kiritimatiellia bacterium]